MSAVRTASHVDGYPTGRVGGLTMFERPLVGVLADETFLTGQHV